MALTPAQQACYERDGALFPLPCLTSEQAGEALQRLDAIEAAKAGRLPRVLNVKAHLLLPWLWDLIHDPRIVEPVLNVLGPDLVCLGSSFFDKKPGQVAHVPWHQDATYWGLCEPRALTVWVAFTPSTPENGCLRIVPGTHHQQLRHEDSCDDANMLPARERVAQAFAEQRAVDVVLEPGACSIHHVMTLHGSLQNRSTVRRTGFTIRYAAGDVALTTGGKGSATWVCGRDHGHYQFEAQPRGELHGEDLSSYVRLIRSWSRSLQQELAGPTRRR